MLVSSFKPWSIVRRRVPSTRLAASGLPAEEVRPAAGSPAGRTGWAVIERSDSELGPAELPGENTLTVRGCPTSRRGFRIKLAALVRSLQKRLKIRNKPKAPGHRWILPNLWLVRWRIGCGSMRGYPRHLAWSVRIRRDSLRREETG
jgi:hypothetical protein